MKRAVFRWLTVVLGGASCFYGTIRSSEVHAEIRIQPFYLEQTISMRHSGDGAFWPAKHVIVARKSDGTTVRSESLGPSDDAPRVRTVLSPAGMSVTLYDSLRMKTTWPLRRDGPEVALGRQLASVSSDCHPPGPPTVVGFATIQDVAVAVSKEVRDENISTRWSAPALACEDLYYRNEERQADGTFAVVYETVTTKLVLGEPGPEAELFVINDDYTESTPSDALNALVRASGLTPSPEELRHLRHEGEADDALYQRARPNQP